RESASAFTPPAFGFSTKYQDGESGLCYYGYRYYDPVTGRWPSRDPIDEDGGINLYSFSTNNGASKIDILGMRAISDVRNRMVQNYGSKIKFALRQFDLYGHKFSFDQSIYGNFDGNYRSAKIKCDENGSLDLEAHWGMEALREWADSGSGSNLAGDRYFDNISRKWALSGDKAGDTGGVLGSQLDWLHLFSAETSSSKTAKMYTRFQLPNIYLWVFTGSDSLWADRFPVMVPIVGNGMVGPAGLHSDLAILLQTKLITLLHSLLPDLSTVGYQI
ncbi:MAG: RHS repeat-associated core domain-containing protein, partial [Proteobacteria bacterium]